MSKFSKLQELFLLKDFHKVVHTYPSLCYVMSLNHVSNASHFSIWGCEAIDCQVFKKQFFSYAQFYQPGIRPTPEVDFSSEGSD